jgi:hypothetical protein
LLGCGRMPASSRQLSCSVSCGACPVAMVRPGAGGLFFLSFFLEKRKCMCFIIIWSEMGIWDTEHNHAGTHCRRRLPNHSCTGEFTRKDLLNNKIAKQSLEIVWKMAIFSLLPESLAENGCLLSSYFFRVFFLTRDGSPRRCTIIFHRWAYKLHRGPTRKQNYNKDS